MRFSERKGYRPVSEIIQTEGMSDSLRASLWNVLDQFLWSSQNFMYYYHGEAGITIYSKTLWGDFFKKPVDTRSRYPEQILKDIRDFFFECEWYEVYDFLEFTLAYLDNNGIRAVNAVLERELSGYRFVSGIFTDITDAAEVEMLQKALDNTDFPGVRNHLQRALELLSNREAPDYRNSIKESISAVESLCKELTRNPKATLGDALKIIERQGRVHVALREAFSKLYGYTSDEGGIRHAMLEEPDLDAHDARFFLLSCTSFVHYLKAKA
jgi:hypothetical protein